MITKHDYYCRCRTCKPPLVGEDRWLKAKLAIVGAAALAGALVALFT